MRARVNTMKLPSNMHISTDDTFSNPQDVILPSPHVSGLAAYHKLQNQSKSDTTDG